MYASMQIIIFSPYHVIVRPTKIVRDIIKDLRILIFKVIFQNQSNLSDFFCEEF